MRKDSSGTGALVQVRRDGAAGAGPESGNRGGRDDVSQ